jgi:hypothetical protein
VKNHERIQWDKGADDYRRKFLKPCSTCKYVSECSEELKQNDQNPDKRLCVQAMEHGINAMRQGRSK